MGPYSTSLVLSHHVRSAIIRLSPSTFVRLRTSLATHAISAPVVDVVEYNPTMSTLMLRSLSVCLKHTDICSSLVPSCVESMMIPYGPLSDTFLAIFRRMQIPAQQTRRRSWNCSSGESQSPDLLQLQPAAADRDYLQRFC